MKTVPMNWPIGDGPDFRGVYDLQSQTVHLFERTHHGSKRAPVSVASLDDTSLDMLLGTERAATLRDDIELISSAGAEFDLEAVLRGELTPVCFGSAITNFGVQLFLDTFVQYAPAPGPCVTSEAVIEPDQPEFSGFVFKIQANMDPRHRDRVAFLRICSGRYSRDMEVWHARMRRRVRLAPPLRLFGQEREVIEEAYAGDVIGVINPGLFAIGDTVSERDLGNFPPLPRFQPEHFALVRATRSDKYKQFLKGLTQIEEEGAIQLFYPVASGRREPILAAVGALQFDVVRFRLESEYTVETVLEPLSFSAVRWVKGDTQEIAAVANSRGRLRAEDRDDNPVILFSTAWDLRYAEENSPSLQFSPVPFDA
jgi:peptide chain release factor 3